jgi:hypothetical protein
MVMGEPFIPREPTADECTRRAKVMDHGWAGWYPQMGGYVSKCVAVPAGDCWDVYVWHDGDFPFREGRPPRELHHCEPAQFVEFGNWLIQLRDGNGE